MTLQTEDPNQPTSDLYPDIAQCIAMLEAIVQDRSLLAKLSSDERKKLVMAAGLVAKPDRLAVQRMVKTMRREARTQEREARTQKREADKAAKGVTQIRRMRVNSQYVAPLQIDAPRLPAVRELSQAQNCYVCKTSYTGLHHFYDSMCQTCGDFNYMKRFQTADLRGRVSIITGARVKIGYHAALMHLRAGASVIVTTRFPHDAAMRYRRERDFSQWAERLHIFGLDLRHTPSVEAFVQYVCASFERLDFLINNAAQTVRRPRGFYAHLLPNEQILPQDKETLALLSHFLNCRRGFEKQLASAQQPGLITYATDQQSPAAAGLCASARMSQIALLPEDLNCGSEIFPAEHYDADRQQVDLRATNSWRAKLGEVPTAEMLEIQLINAVAPFVLCSKLLPLMQRHPTGDKHIVNVSAMEGKFSRYIKTTRHPHTNMAKAALNMMTQTSAPDYVESGIHMNAVDTGWVTDEDPAQHATRKRDELGFQPPLDIVDGAARICDPIFSSLFSKQHTWGKFLKDYVPTDW